MACSVQEMQFNRVKRYYATCVTAVKRITTTALFGCGLPVSFRELLFGKGSLI